MIFVSMPNFISKNFIDSNAYKLKRMHIDGIRLYRKVEDDGIRYPSVTTVTDYPKRHIFANWRKKIGHEEAERITNEAKHRGTVIHDMTEDYLFGREGEVYDEKYANSFNKVKYFIDNYVKEVLGIECKLYSDNLVLAGTADLIAVLSDGKKDFTCIVDFKTSKQRKPKEWFDNYFMQGTAYSIALYERSGIKAPYVVLVMAVDDESKPILHVEKVQDWLEPLQEARMEFAQEKGV